MSITLETLQLDPGIYFVKYWMNQNGKTFCRYLALCTLHNKRN